MSKHTHHQSKAEQIDNKAQGTQPFHYDPYKPSEVVKSEEDIQTKAAEEDSSIKLRAYQIHLEKGGSDLDNWLEAERSLSSNDKAVSRLVNEGDPNTQALNK
jgi:hypothetical protein